MINILIWILYIILWSYWIHINYISTQSRTTINKRIAVMSFLIIIWFYTISWNIELLPIFNLLFIYFVVLLSIRQKKILLKNSYIRKTWIESIIDVMPAMFRIKDKENRFLYTNDEIDRKLLLSDCKSKVIWKTWIEIAEEILARWTEYTFWFQCSDSDQVTIETGEKCSFLEDGSVDGKYLALRVNKIPYYLEWKFGWTIWIWVDKTTSVTEHIELNNILTKIKKIVSKKKDKDPRICKLIDEFNDKREHHVNKYYFSWKSWSKLVKVYRNN